MNKLNIGLNITKNVEKYNLFLDKIKIHLKDYSHCEYYNVSDLKNLNQRISNLDVLLTYNINEDIYKQANDRLKWIHFGVAGVEKNLFNDIIKSKVILTNSKGIHARPVSEFILACILYHAKRFENCNEFKISIEKNKLKSEALEWSITRGARSGRVAWQFIQDLASRHKIKIF